MTTLSAGSDVVRGEARTACACSHCGLPVPAGLIEEGSREQFCCGGCRTVFGVLRAGGLDQYYRVREAVDSRPERAKVTGARYEYDAYVSTTVGRALPARASHMSSALELA